MHRAIRHLQRADPVLGEIIDRVGSYRIIHSNPDFETLARSIVFQQLSGASARAIYARLRDAVGNGGRLTPEGILVLSPAEARRVGLSRRKAEYLRGLAESTLAGAIDFARLPEQSDREVIASLTAVKGIGVWSAKVFLIFALQRLDVLASSDLGIRSAVRMAYRLRSLPTPAKVETLGAKWAPYRSVACWYLWRSLDSVPPA